MVPLSSRGHQYGQFPAQREEDEARSFHISKLSASKSQYTQAYYNEARRSEKRQKLKKERTISLIKKLQEKNQAAFSFRETLLQQLRQRFARFAACALRMKRAPPGHARKSYISTGSIDSSKSNFLQSGSLDIRDILVNYISKDKKPAHSSHHALRLHGADSRTTVPNDRSEIDLPSRKLFRDSQSFTDGYPLPAPDVSGSSVPPTGPSKTASLTLAKQRGNNAYSSSETERAGMSRFARYHRKSSLVTPSPLNNINSARSNRGQSQPEVQIPLNSYRERQCHNFTPLQDTVHYPSHYSQQQPQLSTPVKYHIQSYLERQQHKLQLSDFLSLAQCQRCHHTQLTLITTSTHQQLSPTFVEKVRALIPAVSTFSTDQSTVTPDMTTALQSVMKTEEQQRCADIRESKGGKYGKTLQSPKPSGRRINPYEEEGGCSSTDQKESTESQEEDLRNFFMDGLYLSSEKKQRPECETPLDAGEINQLTQIGDELVDSFYKLSDTLGTSQGLLQQGGLHAAMVPSVLEQIIPVSTARSHRRQNSSSILSSVCEPILKAHRSSQSEQQSGVARPRYHTDEEEDRSQQQQQQELQVLQNKIRASQRLKRAPNETDMSLVLFGDDSLVEASRASVAIPPPRSGSVNSHYSCVNNSVQRISERKRAVPVNAVSSTNPFDSPEEESMRVSFAKEQRREETTRRSLSAEPKNEVRLPHLSQEEITRNVGVGENVPTARFKETGSVLLREEERRVVGESRGVHEDRVDSELSKMKCGGDMLGLFPEEISEIVHQQGDTPFLLDMEELENVESKGPSSFSLEKSESKYDSSPEGGLPAPRGVSEKVYSKCSNTHTKTMNKLHPGISVREDLSFEKQSCLELPAVSPIQEDKVVVMSQKQALSRRSSIEISNFADAPKRLCQTRPHAQQALNSLIASSRESSSSNSRSQGVSYFSSTNCQERLHSAHIASTRTSDISQEPPKKSDISPKPFKIPKSAVQPKTQRNFKITGFSRVLKKFGGVKAPSPPLKSSSRTIAHFGKRKSLAPSKTSKTAVEGQGFQDPVYAAQSTHQMEGPGSTKQKLASTISSLLGGTTSFGCGKKNSESFLNFSGTLKKKSGMEANTALELLFQKRVPEVQRQNVPPLQLQDLGKRGHMESRSKRSTRGGECPKKRGMLRVKKVQRSNSEERK